MPHALKLARPVLMLVLFLALAGRGALAHFQELIPSSDIVSAGGSRDLVLDIRFTHPMEGRPVMSMDRPARFGVVGPGGDQDLGASLVPVLVDGSATYRAAYRVERPGDYVFYLVPAPYWEPAEGVMIVHYAKVVVDAFAGGGGWDRPVGLPVEIEPLTRPYGLWTGNLFRGRVLRDGQPVPFAEVEVEWRNDGSVTPPADAFVTQVIKADAAGVFAYGIPRAGWWGFAALLEGAETMANPDGVKVPVERGALIWVNARDMR